MFSSLSIYLFKILILTNINLTIRRLGQSSQSGLTPPQKTSLITKLKMFVTRLKIKIKFYVHPSRVVHNLFYLIYRHWDYRELQRHCIGKHVKSVG